MPVRPTGQLWVYEPYVPVCMCATMVACKMCLKPHFHLLSFLHYFLLAVLTPMAIHAQVQRQESVCVDSAGVGRMSIQRLASALITSHCPALANPLLGSIHTYVLSSVALSARESDCAYSKYVCMYMHMYMHV